MTPEEMKRRTKEFAIRVIELVENLPAGRATDILGRQLIQSSTSVGSNYRAACLGRSRAEFSSKLQIALEEADESQYWLEMLEGCGLSHGMSHKEVYQEAREITAILMAALKTTKGIKT
jgi:four helix bundle protein